MEQRDLPSYKIFPLVFLLILISVPSFASDNPKQTFGEVENNAVSEGAQAQKEIELLNKYYNDGKDYLYKKDFDKAASKFKEVLNMLPSYEPAKKYLDLIESDKQASLVEECYNKAKVSAQRGDYNTAISNFEQAIKAAPYNDYLKEYFNVVVVQYKISANKQEIDQIKLKMADVVAEYDARIKQVDGLGLSYLLEQALLRCQAGDFAGAEYYYDLCYKIDPNNKERLTWFIEKTYELKGLIGSLDKAYNKIEELSSSGL